MTTPLMPFAVAGIHAATVLIIWIDVPLVRRKTARTTPLLESKP